jgi:hypothetical protein
MRFPHIIPRVEWTPLVRIVVLPSVSVEQGQEASSSLNSNKKAENDVLSLKCNSRSAVNMERIYHGHTNVLYAIRLSAVWNIKHDISAYTLEISLLHANSAQSDMLDPMN